MTSINSLFDSYRFMIKYIQESQNIVKEELLYPLLQYHAKVVQFSYRDYIKKQYNSFYSDLYGILKFFLHTYITYKIEKNYESNNDMTDSDLDYEKLKYKLSKIETYVIKSPLKDDIKLILNDIIGEDNYDELLKECKYLYNAILDNIQDHRIFTDLEKKKINIECSKFTKNIFSDIQEKVQEYYNDQCMNKAILITDRVRNAKTLIKLDEELRKYIEKNQKSRKEDSDGKHIRNSVKSNVFFIDIFRHCKLLRTNYDCSTIVGSQSNILYIYIMGQIGANAREPRFYRQILDSFIYNFCVSKTSDLFYTIKEYIYWWDIKLKINKFKWYLPSESILNIELHPIHNSYFLTLSDQNIVRLYQTDKPQPVRILHFTTNIIHLGFFLLEGEEKNKTIGDSYMWLVDELNDLKYLKFNSQINNPKYEELNTQLITTIPQFKTIKYSNMQFAWEYKGQIHSLNVIDLSIEKYDVEQIVSKLNLKYFNNPENPGSELKLSGWLMEGHILYLILNQNILVVYNCKSYEVKVDVTLVDSVMLTMKLANKMDKSEDKSEERAIKLINNLVIIGYKKGILEK